MARPPRFRVPQRRARVAGRSDAGDHPGRSGARSASRSTRR